MTDEKLKPVVTRARLVEMYAAYPDALEDEVARVLADLRTDDDRARHNAALTKIKRMLPTATGQRLLWKTVAKAIVNAALNAGE